MMMISRTKIRQQSTNYYLRHQELYIGVTTVWFESNRALCKPPKPALYTVHCTILQLRLGTEHLRRTEHKIFFFKKTTKLITSSKILLYFVI